jgi:putative acetyltransferase
VRIEIDDVTRPEVLALLEEHLDHMRAITPPEHVFALDATKLRTPDVTFWTAWDGGALLGCAALKEMSPAQGEVKSMRTPARLRRTGAGRALLNHLIETARKRGYRELFLETGKQDAFEPARTLYRSAGFRDCGPFGSYSDNGNSVFMSINL